MKRRIIINIEDDTSDVRAVALVAQIIDAGRVSETGNRKHYCHASRTAGGTVIYASKRNDMTDTFTIYTPSK